MNSFVLICAVLASMASGVLLAYGVCVGMFEAFRIHSTQVREQRRLVAAAATRTVQG